MAKVYDHGFRELTKKCIAIVDGQATSTRGGVRLPQLVSDRFLGFSATGVGLMDGSTKHGAVQRTDTVIDGQNHHLFNVSVKSKNNAPGNLIVPYIQV